MPCLLSLQRQTFPESGWLVFGMQARQSSLLTGTHLAGSPRLFRKCRPENEAEAAAYTDSGADASLTMFEKLPVKVTLLPVTLMPTSLLPGPKITDAPEGGRKFTPVVNEDIWLLDQANHEYSLTSW